ncbi:MAG: leucine--tRNA ligase [Candidatus Woesearchaeota archaeon]
MINYKEIEQKWINKWQNSKVFESNPDKKKKFFLTFPYPYINGLPHIGHFYTIMKVDAFARYKRLKGFNVLFPQAFHCTGSPIVSAAQRIAENEEKQVKMLKDIGIQDNRIKDFSDPKEWVKYFPPEYKKDIISAGISIDWRREFITTEINPYYDKFIRWQFNKLKQKNLIIKGKHPVVWCQKENSPVSDHARIEGEGETPQEFTLLKFPLLPEKKEYLVAATLRPETIYGQTNLWIGPDINYVKSRVNNEIWIVSRECVEKLKEQERNIEILGVVKGKDLIGKNVVAPGINKEIIILPSLFCDPKKGTGIVTSVPSDAPDDYIGLKDIQIPEECKKYNLDYNEIIKIKPIPIIESKDIGNIPAQRICEELQIKNQMERKKLEKAKQIIYKKGFYEGVILVGKYKGEKVEVAKDKVKNDLINEGKAEIFYELSGKVVCRCLTESIVKIVSNQWFIKYSDKNWKKKAHKALDNIKLYPEKSRAQFEYVIDWIKDWACTREFGLGTRLPWDEKWIIESLSDSTIYTAFYTISHLIKNLPIDKINDDFFDYVFLDGKKPDIDGIEELKNQFNYYYPVDYRNSGKDLIQNHFIFYIFNHCAIFPEKHWPKGIGVNGWVLVNGQKMSKSLGNVIPLRNLIREYSADAARLTILNGGEGMDDPNWDSSFAKSVRQKIDQFYDFCIENYSKGRDTKTQVDDWFDFKINSLVWEITEAMDETNFRTAIQKSFFEFFQKTKWYIKRTNNNPNIDLINKAIEVMTIVLNPFIPFTCEEIWEKIGKNKSTSDFVSLSKWPVCKKIKQKIDLEIGESLIEQIIIDINSLIKLLNKKPDKITIIIADQWKHDFFKIIKKEFDNNLDLKQIMDRLTKTELKKHANEISNILPKLMKNRKINDSSTENFEFDYLTSSKEFLENEFKSEFQIVKERESKNKKALNSLPQKPAIIIE